MSAPNTEGPASGGHPGRRASAATWKARLHQYREFTERHGRIPKVGARGIREHRLAVWMRNQRSAARTGATWLTPERIELLDVTIPNWDSESDRRTWDERMEQASQFYAKQQRLPSTKGNSDLERTLGWWLVKTRRWLRDSDPRLTVDRLATLDLNLPPWRPSPVNRGETAS